MSAVAVLNTPAVQGEIIATKVSKGTQIRATFRKLPKGKHGFHIHRAGDLRGEGCAGACEHYHRGKPQLHGGKPSTRRARHTGDLGNVEMRGKTSTTYSYFLPNVPISDLYGRSIIVHADEDDLGLGAFPDSHTTGHSGSRIACGIFGRISCTRRRRKN